MVMRPCRKAEQGGCDGDQQGSCHLQSADNYNGAMPAVLPLSTAHWRDASFAVGPVFSALAGTGGFYQLAPEARIAFVEGATLATILNWTRFELAMSERKALAERQNWALTNGSTKNWNEIFAFHSGPEGQHSVHAALERPRNKR